MILSPRPYSAKLRKLRRRLRDHRYAHPWIAMYPRVLWWRRGPDKGRQPPKGN